MTILSRFVRIPKRDGRTDRWTDERLYQYRASVCWHAIKSTAFTCAVA